MMSQKRNFFQCAITCYGSGTIHSYALAIK